MTLAVNPALSSRKAAAQDLLKTYDAVTTDMKRTLDNVDTYYTWTSYFKYQEIANEQNLFDKKMDEASKLLDDVISLNDQKVKVVSAETLAIRNQLERMKKDTGVSLERARILMEAAEAKADQAGREAQWRSILDFGKAISSAGSSLSEGNSNPAQSSDPTSEPNSTLIESTGPIAVPRVLRFGEPLNASPKAPISAAPKPVGP
ncbi:hypothetical protein GOB36_14250 [Sinorhizobium meliloti]|uniref:hypothetical protein n=1 Tax=Rhizobium meliloti TaxID=382 RepID=UPI00299E02BF|nr:hypothetical protein [Sinorhizobium meliloti]MDW9511256.1 hypothetical protein [Sinorhizobium meliloti]MDW9921694.1 hypothetical protein [Sinorhizobium meliloti]MDW9925999.1 hypothetical protein [Sinorhizobium meliloti]MDX0032840.1 hypothetical protein [Sinorhizobium meliloti]